MSKTRKTLRGGIGTLLGWTLLVVLAAVLLAVWSFYPSPASIARALDEGAPWFLAWRLALFGVLIGLWPFWADRIARWYSLDRAQHAQLIEARWTVALWLIALELLLGQNLFGRFVSFVVGYLAA